MSDKFFASSGMVAGYSCRADGNMSLAAEPAAGALENRKRYLTAMGIDHRALVTSRQIHSNTVRAVNIADKGKGALDRATAFTDTDAFVTNHHRLPIAVFTADCLPVFLFDPRTPAVGIVHAGWRSTHKRIVSRAVRCMQTVYRTEPANLLVAFGPAIRECCYEVSGELPGLFPGALMRRQQRVFLDLAGANTQELISCGVRPEAICDTRLCTCCLPDRFYSYRRDQASGMRMVSVIMLT